MNGLSMKCAAKRFYQNAICGKFKLHFKKWFWAHNILPVTVEGYRRNRQV